MFCKMLLLRHFIRAIVDFVPQVNVTSPSVVHVNYIFTFRLSFGSLIFQFSHKSVATGVFAYQSILIALADWLLRESAF
jgi:hypothetical protein